MKMRSYQNQLFTPFLFVSFVGHALAFGTAAGVRSLSPQFGVEQARNSVEIVLSKSENETRRTQAMELFTASDSPVRAPFKKTEKEHKPKRRAKSIYIPPQKGASSSSAVPHLNNPAPVYPESAREKGWEGTVIVSAFVEKDGTASQVKILKSSGYQILDQAALKTLRKWRFKPASIGQFPFSVSIDIPIRFQLDG